MKRLLLIGLMGLIGVGAGAWYLISPLFIDQVVDEAFPLEVAAPARAQVSQGELDQVQAALGDQLPVELPSAAELADMPVEAVAALEAEIMEAATEIPDKAVADSMPEAVAADPTAVLEGQFQDADSFHQGAGTATIYELPDGAHLLRFEEFSVTNGPDLHVILSKHPNPTSQADIGTDYIDLGSLKGNLGNQNYEIPTGVDLSEYQSIVIYCKPFHVVFSVAALS
ncbi:MAG TPA: DM13 domain-containing protein [Anaerolineae bacterium]|nr:DM13 domain-containing protein [Anaerolineae bacterium]HMR63939.1 DM13 domain-containing protein [Anaerolineae bacterium]